jgi:hypothetical protein
MDRHRSLADAGLEPDPVIEVYKKDVDRTLLRENLKLTPQQRLEKFVAFMTFLDGVRGAGARRGAGHLRRRRRLLPDSEEHCPAGLCARPSRAVPAGAPPGLPFTWDALTVSRGLNFTLTTIEALLEERGRQ